MFRKLPILIRLFLFVFLINFVFVWAYSYFSKTEISPAIAEDSSLGEKLFKNNCSGCHSNGQNLIKPNKPIIGSLKLKSKESFKLWLENPSLPMPSFKNITSKNDQFEALYSYVVSLMGK